ncbi:hypothetical protein PG999_011627 [Apiospora kogelbergensis]|uniref:Rhomboid family membrane protein n=1 Tax=Apiospora kogelbergensis TaxID=1337665 RepID=A0AAW0QDP1_9PEZI
MATPNDAATSPPGGGALETPQQPPPSKFKDPFIHNVALGATPIAVFGLLLPPRRLNFQMVLLGGVALWGMNQLQYDYRGQSIAQKYGLTRPDPSGVETLREQEQKLKFGVLTEMPTERSAMIQKRIREEKARRIELAGLSDTERAERLEQMRQKEKERRGALESIWMGDADADWREKREKKEKEALQEGGVGYWGLITEQLSEVWTHGEKKAQEKEAELKKQVVNAKDKVGSDVKKSS